MTQLQEFSYAGRDRIVVKIGSSLLVDEQLGLRHTWLNSIADDIKMLVEVGKEVLVVSSGAIALGRQILNVEKKKLRLAESQAAAAVGQIELGRIYREVLEYRGLTCGQVLLTLDDTEQRRRYLNARATIQSLFSMGAVPVVNENDTTATHEIRYGDNDRLSARVATMSSADLLILFSDVDGLYSGPPENRSSEFIPIVNQITPEIESMAGGSASNLGTGGMVTKIQAAKIATQSGTEMIIASGKTLNPISNLLSGANFTRFLAQGTPRTARKKWIASDLAGGSAMVVDEGAQIAIGQNRSLLPIGVCKLEGEFCRGDIVEIKNRLGTTLGRGISNYDSTEAQQIIGHKADQIKLILGYDGPENLIHRDDMVVFESHGG